MSLRCGLSVDIDLGPWATAMRTSARQSIFEVVHCKIAMCRELFLMATEHVIDGGLEGAKAIRVIDCGSDMLTAGDPKRLPGTST